ncbi:MAG: O-antigen ligase family protein [Mariprofundaceae bacterium]|nr:O-antigen ligase family protein [Mariprofundaceae bacterium]
MFFITPYFTTNILDYWVATDLLALGTALLAAAWMQYTAPPEKNPNSWILLVLFLIPVFIHLVIQDTPNPWGLVKYSIYITAVFLMFRMSQASSHEWIQSTSWIALLAITGNVYALTGVMNNFQIFPEDQTSLFALWSFFPDFAGPLLQRNLATLFLLIVVISLWVKSIRDAWDKRWLVASVLPCAIILISNSRSAMLFLILLVIVLFVLHPKKKSCFLHLSAVLSVSLLIAFQWHDALQSIQPSITHLGSRLTETGVSARLNIWYSSWFMLMDHPWIGIGSGNLASYFSDYQGQSLALHPEWIEMDSITPWSHNIILQHLAEAGLLGGAFIFLLIGIIVRRIYHILQTPNPIQHPSFSAVLIVSLLLLHGLISISLLQGFFLALFGLYLAALFPCSLETRSSPQTIASALYVLPAFYLLLIAYQYIHTQANIRAVFDDNPDSSRFISAVAPAIDNPWQARVGLAYLFVNMDLTHAPAHQWVNLYPYLYEYWLLCQEPWGLKRLILQAHLADNSLSEIYLAKQYRKNFPKNVWNKQLLQHIQVGHQKHEALEMQ